MEKRQVNSSLRETILVHTLPAAFGSLVIVFLFWSNIYMPQRMLITTFGYLIISICFMGMYKKPLSQFYSVCPWIRPPAEQQLTPIVAPVVTKIIAKKFVTKFKSNRIQQQAKKLSIENKRMAVRRQSAVARLQRPQGSESNPIPLGALMSILPEMDEELGSSSDDDEQTKVNTKRNSMNGVGSNKFLSNNSNVNDNSSSTVSNVKVINVSPATVNKKESLSESNNSIDHDQPRRASPKDKTNPFIVNNMSVSN